MSVVSSTKLLVACVIAFGALSAMPAEAQIRAIEINQAVGAQKGGALKFVAGKDTVVRVFLAAPVSVDPAQTRATVIRDGGVVATLEPVAAGGPTQVVDFLCPSRDACGNWAAGSYVFEVSVNGESASTAGTTYAFVPRRELRILVMPVRANYNGTVTQVEGNAWRETGTFTRRTYPVSNDAFKWTVRGELDASDARFDLETEEGRQALWQALADLMPRHCAADRSAPDCFELIIGFVSDRANGFPEGTLQGYTYGAPANIVVAKDEDAAATVAHEIAHTFGIGDTYDGGTFHCAANPAPDAFTGKDWNDNTASVRCMAGRSSIEGGSGTRIPAEANLYEVGGRGALGESVEFMGSGSPQARYWISPEIYDWIFDRSAPGSALPGLAAHVGDGVPRRLLDYFGFTRPNPNSPADLDLAPWESFVDDILVPDTTGPYMIAAVDATGRRLATQALAVDFIIPGPKGEPPTVLPEAPFEGLIPFPPATTAFQILFQDRVVQELRVSPNAPVVGEVTPTGPDRLAGPVTLRWSASDADGDALTYSVLYNPDVDNPESDWWVLDADLPDAFYVQDFAELPGGNNARILVVATDGINGAEAESAPFVVPFKAPELFIVDPEDEATVERDVVLEVETFDLQDDTLEDVHIEWESDVSGFLGRGEAITVRELPVGEHEITVTGRNSAGLSGSDTIVINVVP